MVRDVVEGGWRGVLRSWTPKLKSAKFWALEPYGETLYSCYFVINDMGSQKDNEFAGWPDESSAILWIEI